MFVLDSLGNLSTNKEIEDTLAEKTTRDMTKAQLVKGAFRMLTLKLGQANIPMIVTNHVYDPMSLYEAKKMGGGSLSSIKVQGEHKSISIEAKCLDEYNFLDDDFIKIDVEGHEHEVIEGAQETINKFKPTMVIEMEEKHNQIPIEDQISSVEKLGYKCCVLMNKKIIQKKISRTCL